MSSGAVTKIMTSSTDATTAVFVVLCPTLMLIRFCSNKYSNGFKTKANSSMQIGQPCLTERRMGKGHSFIPQSALRQLHNLFQSEFSKQGDLVLPLSISSIVCLPYGHPVAAYVFYPRGAAGLQPPPKSKFKKQRFCTYDGIKRLT